MFNQVINVPANQFHLSIINMQQDKKKQNWSTKVDTENNFKWLNMPHIF